MTTETTTGGYCHLFRPERRPAQPEPDQEKLRLFAIAESVSDARRALRRAREQYESTYRRDLAALESLTQDLMLAVLRDANGEEPSTR